MAVTGDQIVAEILKFKGNEYVYGKAGSTTFDCSGLIMYGLSKLGISAPRTSEQQWAWVDKITAKQLQPGDLVFMQFPGDDASPGHVEVYIGGGQILGADDPAQGVAVTSLSSVASNIVGYGRVPKASYKGEPMGTGGKSLLSSLGSDISGLVGGLTTLVLPSQALDFFDDAEKFVRAAMWFVDPVHWMRVVAGIAGLFFLTFGVGFLVWAAA